MPQPRRILSVGQCSPDDAALRRFVGRHFDAQIVGADTADEALALLDREAFDLVLVNRKLDADYSDGLEIVRRMRQDAKLAGVHAMLVSNHADQQQLAVAAGALPGFGKLEYDRPETLDKLRAVLG